MAVAGRALAHLSGGVRWRSTRTAVPQGDRLAASRRRGGRPVYAWKCGERAFGRVGDGQPRRVAPAALIAELADAEARVLQPAGTTTTPFATPALGNDGWCDCCGLVEPLCCQLFRDRATHALVHGDQESVPHLGR